MAGIAPTYDIAARAAEITSTDSPLMRKAAATGAASANRRGLINSSMGIGAAQDAVLNVAVPMASQESAQAATADNLRTQISSNEGMAARELTSREKLSADQIASNEGLAGRDLASREKLSADQIRSNETLAGRDIASRETISTAQLAAAERERLSTSQATLSGNYQQAVANTLNNDKIPAAERASVLASIKNDYNNAVRSIQQLYGVAPPAPATNTPVGIGYGGGGYFDAGYYY